MLWALIDALEGKIIIFIEILFEVNNDTIHHDTVPELLNNFALLRYNLLNQFQYVESVSIKG